MAKFCTKCGNPLEDGAKCNCGAQSGVPAGAFFSKLFSRMGVDFPTTDSVNAVERGKQIVPDIVKPNDGEIAVKQYEAAILRSRIRGQWAKGKLQVTNKRVLFRAAGVSYKGHIAQQYEFAIDEIAGIEIKKSNRISGLNLIGAFLLNCLVAPTVADAFSNLTDKAHTAAMLLSIIFAVTSVAVFFAVKRKFWLKLLLMSIGAGALVGTVYDIPSSALGLLTSTFDPAVGVIGTVFGLLMWLNIILVCLVPDLVLCVKTKGASEAFVIRRKQRATLFKQEIEYTGFGEVVPGKDVDRMSSELGALIDDIQTFGDNAIEQWKE